MSSKATTFEFTSYNFEPLKKRVIFNYKTEFNVGEPLIFKETIILPEIPDLKKIPQEIIQKLLQSIHIILGISYYKLYCATNVKLPYNLSKGESDFWNKIYKNGLGEFFYKNNLDPKISPSFPFSNNEKNNSFLLKLKNDECLVGIGGGKDSIVVAELLKNSGFNPTAFYVQTNKESKLTEEVIGKITLNKLKIQRFLDWQIHQPSKYSGHIPISAIYAFLGILSSVLYDYSYFIVGNEYSSNFGNIKYKGMTVNHQWSKSFEFEKLFTDYIKKYIGINIGYFSLLRPFYEIRIVRMFSKMKKYFSYFSSCNSNFKLSNKESESKKWCGQCAKCVFAFTMLSAFVSKKELLKIFGKNLYQEKELLPLFKDIMGLGKMKPFDCVGTFEESQSAMHLAKYNFKNDLVVKELIKKIKFYPEIFNTQKESLIPDDFKFLGMENALIVGYGKEGKINESYLKKYHKNLKVSIVDQKQGKNYLKNQRDFDIAIKTPGIKKELIDIPYTTATNIFFSKTKGKNIIIGVTGSKGKSTTSSLIYEILKTYGKNTKLLGNIGKPMLEDLLKPVRKDTIFVLELSSYQLDDINFSPDIAVVTSLFKEHTDFHLNIKRYFEAKKNIINYQNKNEWLIYGKSLTFDSKTKFETDLIGEHNQQNIRAAISVAKILNIPEEIIIQAIKKFKGLPHRLEFLGEYREIKFYDDAISTTPDSTIEAIKSIKNIDTILLGGQDREYKFSNLEKTIKKYKIRNIVLFPDSGEKIIKDKKYFNILKTDKMDEAIKFAYRYTNKGSVCLLSCASPSYSLWKNFEEKGDQSKKYIHKFSK